MTAADKDLWQKGRRAWSAQSAPEAELDLMDLAAYLDGQPAPRVEDALERRLLVDPAALDLLVASGQALASAADEPAPESLVLRAQGLVRDAAVPDRLGLAARLRDFFDLPRQAAWGGFAAALLVACLAGYEIGYRSMDPADPVLPQQEAALVPDGAVGLDTLAGPLL